MIAYQQINLKEAVIVKDRARCRLVKTCEIALLGNSNSGKSRYVIVD
jgi:GTP-binding protein EngB required for normal cell division